MRFSSRRKALQSPTQSAQDTDVSRSGNHSCGTSRSRGQSSAEMALVAPIMVMLMFVVIEAGWFGFAWVTVQHAARTAARFAATGRGEREGNRGQQIREQAEQATRGLPPGRVHVKVKSWRGKNGNGNGRDNDPGGPCDLVEVEVAYDYQTLVPLVNRLVPEFTMRGRDRKLNEPWTKCP